MEFKNHIPIYLQIIEVIKKDIISGSLKPGEKLESVREMAGRLKVNPNTVQKAYQEMERTGLAFTKRGIGTFISEDEGIKRNIMDDLSNNYVHEFVGSMRELGFTDKEILDKLKKALSKKGGE